jgi:hypothetical protein
MLKHLTHNINPLIKLSFNTLKSTRGIDALSAVTGWCARPRRTGGMGRPADSVAGLGRQAEVVGWNAGLALFPLNFLFFISYYNSKNSYKLLKYVENAIKLKKVWNKFL